MKDINNYTETFTESAVNLTGSEDDFLPRASVFYKYDYSKAKYHFLSTSLKILTGYTREEIDQIGFESLIKNRFIEETNCNYLEGNEGAQIEENFVTYLIESASGNPKWIEDNSFTLIDTRGNKNSRIGFLKDISSYMRNEKVRQIVSEILEASNSKKNIFELFEFIHSCIKKLMKADNFYIASYHKEEGMLSFPYFVDEIDTDSSPKKISKGLTEYVLKTGVSELVDKKRDEELMERGETELIGPQSEIWLGVPLKIKDKTIGVLVLQDYNDVKTYGEAEKQILDVISYPISRAIERKMVEEEREEMINELRELNKSKDRLFSLISHDLRNPFNSLLGFSEILTTEYDTLTQRDIKEYIKVINDSAKSLFGMTNNLLYYSRFQLGKFDNKPEALNCKELINHVLESFTDAAGKKEILIKNSMDDRIKVFANEEMLDIILHNIISNAIKFSNRESTINIYANNFNETGLEDFMSICIEDEGVGFSEEDLEKIKNREMFSTLGTAKEFGSGLGLSLATEFINALNGKLDFQSEEGKGTKVILSLPAEN